MHGLSPPYLQDLISWSHNSRYGLRSSNADQLQLLNIRTRPTLSRQLRQVVEFPSEGY